MNSRKAVNKVAAELGAEIARIQKSGRSNQEARMQALRDRQDAIERRSRMAAVKAAAAQSVVTGVDIYKQDRRRAEAVYDRTSSPSVGSLSSRIGPWFQHKKPAMPDEPGHKGAAIFRAAQQGDVNAQKIVAAAVQAVAKSVLNGDPVTPEVRKARETYAATTGSLNKAAVSDGPTTFDARGLSAAELAGIVARSQQTVKMFRDNLQPGDNTLDPQFMDNVAAHMKIKLDPVTFRPQVQSRASRPNITSDPDNRPGLSDRTGSPA